MIATDLDVSKSVQASQIRRNSTCANRKKSVFKEQRVDQRKVPLAVQPFDYYGSYTAHRVGSLTRRGGPEERQASPAQGGWGL